MTTRALGLAGRRSFLRFFGGGGGLGARTRTVLPPTTTFSHFFFFLRSALTSTGAGPSLATVTVRPPTSVGKLTGITGWTGVGALSIWMATSGGATTTSSACSGLLLPAESTA